MPFVHPIGSMLNRLLAADEVQDPEVAYWYLAQEEMEKRAYSGVAFRRICAQIRMAGRRKTDDISNVLPAAKIPEQEAVYRHSEGEWPQRNVFSGESFRPIFEKIMAVMKQKTDDVIGSVFEVSPGVKRVFDADSAEGEGILTAVDGGEDAMPDKRPAYLGGVPSFPKASLTREQTSAILDEPEVSILDSDNYAARKSARLKSQTAQPAIAKDTQNSGSPAKLSAENHADDQTHSVKGKKQKFINKCKVFGKGGRSDRNRGRKGPTNYH